MNDVIRFFKSKSKKDSDKIGAYSNYSQRQQEKLNKIKQKRLAYEAKNKQLTALNKEKSLLEKARSKNKEERMRSWNKATGLIKKEFGNVRKQLAKNKSKQNQALSLKANDVYSFKK